jgi:CRP-like cAMP-binding protein
LTRIKNLEIATNQRSRTARRSAKRGTGKLDLRQGIGALAIATFKCDVQQKPEGGRVDAESAMPNRKLNAQEYLARLPLFNELQPEELADVAAAASERSLARGELVFRRGDPCVGFHIVVYGQVKLAFVSSHGQEKVVELIGPGHSFGEALMFMEKPYIVTATTLADTLLLHVPAQAVFAGLERDRRFARKMLAGLSQRIHGLISDVEAYSLSSGTQRVIGYLLKEDPSSDGSRVRLEVSKSILASRLNLTPEHFSRILGDLIDQQLIEVDKRDITILDLERLRRYEGK